MARYGSANITGTPSSADYYNIIIITIVTIRVVVVPRHYAVRFVRCDVSRGIQGHSNVALQATC